MPRRLVVLFLVCLLSACASAPGPAPPPPPALAPIALPAPAPPPRLNERASSTFCNQATNVRLFSRLGLPPDEEPVDVAVTADFVWVLFQPARLLRLRRTAGEVESATLTGAAGELWVGMDVDPADGSLWIATDRLAFHRVTGDLEQSTILLQRKVLGKGGLERVLMARDAIYAAPFCGDYGVWRLDRQGHLLGTYFPTERRKGEILDPDTMKCSHVRIEREGKGAILARDSRQQVYRVDGRGIWSPAAGTPLDAMPSPSTRRSRFHRGEAGEMYAAAGFTEGLFSWKGRTAYLGSDPPKAIDPTGGFFTRMQESAQMVYTPGEDRLAKGLATCLGEPVLDVATDAAGYAVITLHAVGYGDFAHAPDLP
ncbi:MAG TPA: hypothetical protein VOA87_14085 [Thermoanaerobaculia bacterium]|nr:hypothetical protein [Thermoanaerobaculia bacterium]